MRFIRAIIVLMVFASSFARKDMSTEGPSRSLYSSEADDESALISSESEACVSALFYEGLKQILDRLKESVDSAADLADEKGCAKLARYLRERRRFWRK